MNVSHKLKLIWFAPARTASRALHALLEQYDFVNLIEGENADLRIHPHTHECRVPVGLEHYNIILQTRNPYSKIVSLWHLDNYNYTLIPHLMPNKRCEAFKDFIFNSLSLQNYYNNFDSIPKVNPKYIIRYENFAEDVLKLDFINFNDPINNKIYRNNIASNSFLYERSPSPTLSVDSNYAHWQTHYTQELADIVYRATENYFIRFGYERNSWKTA